MIPCVDRGIGLYVARGVDDNGGNVSLLVPHHVPMYGMRGIPAVGLRIDEKAIQ